MLPFHSQVKDVMFEYLVNIKPEIGVVLADTDRARMTMVLFEMFNKVSFYTLKCLVSSVKCLLY